MADSQRQDAECVFPDNMPLEDQVRELANVIMFEIPGEPSRSKGAIECAIRLLRSLRAELDDLRYNLAQRAFTAPDADDATMLASLDARIRDALTDGADDGR